MPKAKKRKGFTVRNGKYYLAKGYYLTGGGGLEAKRFGLSKVADDPKGTAADLRAAEIRAAWAAGEGVVNGERVRVQTIDYEGRRVRVWATQTPTPTPIPPAPGSFASGAGNAATAYAGETLDAAVDAYLETQRGKSHGHYVTTKHRLRLICSQTVNGQRVGSMVLALYDEAALRGTLAVVSARPTSATGRQFSAVTVRDSLQWFRYFLCWAHDEERWTKPRRFEVIWKDTQYAPKATEEERDARTQAKKDKKKQGDDGRCFSVDELGRLYVAADERSRLLLLLSINCGFGSSELDTLRLTEIEIEGDAPYIARERWKTTKSGTKEGVWAEWRYLFPELVPLLRKAVEEAKARGDQYVLRGTYPKDAEGKPLIGDRLVKKTVDAEGRPVGRYDYWYKAFDWTKKRAWAAFGKANLRDLPAKYLRKSGARLLRHSGVANADALASMYLSHGDTGDGDKVLSNYTDRDWDQLTAALKAMHQQLAPAFKVQRPKLPKAVAVDRQARYAAIMAKARAAKAEKRKEAITV